MLERNIFKFYKEDDMWLIDLPEYIADGGVKEDLYMVAGADCFLDVISKFSNEVNLKISTQQFETAEKLEFSELGQLDGPECGTGAWYYLESYDGFKIWLCNVTSWLFGNFPSTIYFKVI